MNTTTERFARAKVIFREHGGTMRTTEARRAGIHSDTLYGMRDARVVERVSRGLYRLTDLPAPSAPDLLIVGAKIPQGVICLISALAYHNITTRVPHAVDIAIEQNGIQPRLDYPPLSIHWFGGRAFSEGVETHEVDGVSIRVYSPEKTLADCFKYRNKIGLDVATEALQLYRDRQRVKVAELLRYAEICRVKRVMKPYLEAVL